MPAQEIRYTKALFWYTNGRWVLRLSLQSAKPPQPCKPRFCTDFFPVWCISPGRGWIGREIAVDFIFLIDSRLFIQSLVEQQEQRVSTGCSYFLSRLIIFGHYEIVASV